MDHLTRLRVPSDVSLVVDSVQGADTRQPDIVVLSQRLLDRA